MARLGLTVEAAALLDDLQGAGTAWVLVDHLALKRDRREVDRCIAELVRSGFVALRRGARGRQVVELTPVGRLA